MTTHNADDMFQQYLTQPTVFKKEVVRSLCKSRARLLKEIEHCESANNHVGAEVRSELVQIEVALLNAIGG